MTTLKTLLLTAALFASTFQLHAQEKYHTMNIPADMLVHANAVVRLSTTEIDIKSDGKAIINSKIVLTILNEAGNEHSPMYLHYDKFIDVRSFTGKLYDANGVVIKTVKKNDIKDISGTSSSNLADDVRFKSHDFNYKVFPFTVEYETSVELNGLFNLPTWNPLEDEFISAQESVLTVNTPVDYRLRYKEFNYKNPLAKSTTRDVKTYQWKVTNLPAIKGETYSVPWYETTTAVFLAPTTFEIGDYKGSMENWNGLGKFIYALNTGKDILPQNVKAKVHSLTDKLNDPNEKIKALFSYMQQNTRYISIQLGLGGWQPFDATSVAINGYGDCKALTNYMFSLLKEAGIKSHYALIKSGEKNQAILADFPSNQFDHVILCVPQKKDSVWLECTSQTLPAGYLGSFTSNRHALLIGEEGGTLVRTPKYSKSDNLQIRTIHSTLDLSGNVSMNINTNYQAEQQDDVHGFLHSQSRESISNYLKEKLSIPSYDVEKFDYVSGKSGMQSVNEHLKVLAYNFATVTGKRIFVTANILNRSDVRLSDQQSRKGPLKINFEYTDIDSLEMLIPLGYVAESTPKDVLLDTKFGRYSAMFSVLPGKIKYVRKMERNSGLYPAQDALAFADFYKEIYRADRLRFVLVKKDIEAASN